MKQSLFLLVALMFLMGCSSVREDPDDSFAPRPENAESSSYQIVRLGEASYHGDLDKASLLHRIDLYRRKYKKIKTRSDFAEGSYGGDRFKEYLEVAQSFLDSDLDAAEKYIESWPDSISFKKADPDEGKYDTGDISWTDKSRKLRIVDFYSQYYSDDWSSFAFIINMIPTARNGYGRFEFNLNDETLFFRKKVRKSIWTFSSGYFWVYTDILIMEGGEDQVPMLVSISDPNDHGYMNGIYLVLPRKGVSVETSVLSNIDSNVKVLVKTGPNAKTQSSPWSIINKETFPIADIIQHELGRRRTPEQVIEHFRKYVKSFNDEELLKDLIELCQKDRKKFKSLLEPYRKK